MNANERQIARQLFKHDHRFTKETSTEERDLVKDSCAACALEGRNAFRNKDGLLEPNYAGWALVYVQARYAIPASYLQAFVWLVRGHGDIGSRNQAYRDYLLLWIDKP